MQSYLKRVELAINAIKQGKIVIVTDHPDRENEGDFIMAAEKITPETMNFIIRHSSGIVCLSLQETQLKQLNLPFMVPPHANTSLRGTPFTVSIDAKEGITTGVSAVDRVNTILAAIDDHAKPDDLDRPGHIFPLCAKAGGVLERPGHTEGAVDLVTLAGLKPAAVLCELMNPDGTMTKGKQLEDFANEHGLLMISIDDIIDYRRFHENLIEEQTSAVLPLESYGQFNVTVIKEKITGEEHAIIENIKHTIFDKPILVRVHSSCLTGDIFGSLRCDCHQQLHYALQRMSEEGGILIYLNQEGRGIGLLNKIRAYALQEEGLDTVEANQKLGLPADSRNYYLVANILKNRGIKHIRLLTNNPNKIAGLQKYGIPTVEVENVPAHFNPYNEKYLMTKKAKLHHDIHQEDI